MTNSHIAAHVARYIAIVVAKLLQTCSYKAQIHVQCNYIVSRGQTAFFRFSLGWRKKGLVWFTVATRLGTFEVLIYRVIIDLGL